MNQNQRQTALPWESHILSFRQCAASAVLFFIILATARGAKGQNFTYEAAILPPAGGWTLVQALCGAEEFVDDGWLVHDMHMCSPPPWGQQIDYTRSLADVNSNNLFFQFRLVTDGPSSEFPGTAPAALSVASQCGVNYRFVVSADKAKLNRDNLLPIVIVDIQPGVPHTYRLELYGTDQYIWYIDGQVADAGVPEGAYPCLNPAINFRTKANTVPNTTRWDYIRYGTIPAPHSGDFDGDGDVDAIDVYYFVDCLLGPGGAWPGCEWADMNADGVADAADLQPFVNAMFGP